mmetsp:Transcript_26205/g.57639  ORF Transcript_26205/g.57639 Transcript_26205/m.57639 type:complete len:296 (-) Transcript_26205:1365-2252(-)
MGVARGVRASGLGFAGTSTPAMLLALEGVTAISSTSFSASEVDFLRLGVLHGSISITDASRFGADAPPRVCAGLLGCGVTSTSQHGRTASGLLSRRGVCAETARLLDSSSAPLLWTACPSWREPPGPELEALPALLGRLGLAVGAKASERRLGRGGCTEEQRGFSMMRRCQTPRSRHLATTSLLAAGSPSLGAKTSSVPQFWRKMALRCLTIVPLPPSVRRRKRHLTAISVSSPSSSSFLDHRASTRTPSTPTKSPVCPTRDTTSLSRRLCELARPALPPTAGQSTNCCHCPRSP